MPRGRFCDYDNSDVNEAGVNFFRDNGCLMNILAADTGDALPGKHPLNGSVRIATEMADIVRKSL